MKRIKPIHGIAVILGALGLLWGLEYYLAGRQHQADFTRVAPDGRGEVRIATQDLEPLQMRFFRFLNSGNQEVKFFVGRDPGGHLQVAFDANETCAKTKRGYRHDGEWVVCNKCDKAFRLTEVNAGGGGCKPVPLPFRESKSEILLAEADILKGWRLFH
jgi:uncharacterized membrane protein